MVCVDGILLTGSSPKWIHDLINKLHIKFSLKHLGVIKYFLAIEVHHQPNGLMILTQTKYIQDLLSKVNMYVAKGVHTPTVSSYKLSKHDMNALQDPFLYHSTIGALQYLILTRPNVACCVNKACQFMANHLETHWCAIKHILRYLSGTTTHGLMLSPIQFISQVLSMYIQRF